MECTSMDVCAQSAVILVVNLTVRVVITRLLQD
jgi:hypothetical protein